MKQRMNETTGKARFALDEKLNGCYGVAVIATACEKQCIHCNVSSTKLGRTRS